MEYLDDVTCKWPGPVTKVFVCYDTAIESLLASTTREELVVGILNLQQSSGSSQTWTSWFQVDTRTQQPASRPAGEGPASPAILVQPSQVITTQGFRQGDFTGFILGRVMTAGTADSKLVEAGTPAQLLQLSSRMFRFTAQPPACSSQQASQVAASKKIVVEISDDAAANPLAQVRNSGSVGPNAAYLPLSDSGTGNVYIAVIALTDIAAGAEVTVDRGTVTYSRPVHDCLLQAVLSKTDNMQRGPGSFLGQAQHRQARHQQQQQKKKQWMQQNQQQPSLVLLQAEFDSAVAAADLNFQQAADSSKASRSYKVVDDALLKQLRGARQNYKDGTSSTGVAASADIAQRAAAAAATDRIAPAPAEKQREAEEGVAAVLVPPVSAGSLLANSPSAVKPSEMSPRCGTAAPPAAQTPPAGSARAAAALAPTASTDLHAAGPSTAVRPPGTAAPPAMPSPSASAAAAAAAGSPVAPSLQQKWTTGASQPTVVATPERQPRHAPQPPASAAAGSGAAASSSNPMQDSEVGLRSRGRQAAKRAATAIQEQLDVHHKATKQARTSSQRSQQQQLEGSIQSHVLQLSSSETRLQKAAAVSLTSLAYRTKKISSCIVAAGAVQPLVALLNSADSGCQTAAADALFNLLSDHDTTHNALLAAGGTPLLVKMLTSRSGNCQAAAADLLTLLARTEDGAAAVLGTAGSFDAAVSLLRNTDQDVIAAGLQLLIKLLFNRRASSPSTGDAAMLQAAATSVVQLLDSCRYRALEAAASIADIYPHITALREAVPRVAALLSSNSSSTDDTLVHRRAVIREAVRFLYHMAFDDNNLDIIAAADSLKLLIRCIQSPDALCDEGMEFAVGAVYRLINEHPQRQQAAVAAGIVGTARQLLLDSSDTGVLHAALAILWSLAEMSSTVQTEVQSHQAMSTLVELLSHRVIRVRHHAAGLLMVLVKSSTTFKKEVVNTGAIPPLVQLLVSSDNPSVLEDVISAVGSLAVGSDDNQAAIVAQGAVERLKELVSSDSSNVQRGAAAVLKLLERSYG